MPTEAELAAQYGLGAIPSPIDERDYPIAMLYASMGIEEPLAVPLAYNVPHALPPVLNQGNKPQCVAYSSECMKAYEDRIDQGRWFPFDEDRFFARIGGGPNGAFLRAAFDEMRSTGYPLDGGGGASQHKIRAYYAVPVTKASVQAAIMSFGVIVIGFHWSNSWFSPQGNGQLRPFSSLAGGHAIAAVGWDSRGLRLRNSWGSAWGRSGDCWLPWSQLGHAFEVFKAVDVIEKPPAPTPTDPSSYVHTVRVTASPYVNVRRSWSAASADVGNIAKGKTVKTTKIKKAGGVYVVNGVRRRDWLGFVQNGVTRWIARGHTTLVK
ncbi:MAG: C1 family peptidase [Limnohabitans sp.]